jgi:S-(hydroxymethyl)glutathione dehydrogenase/alcohol dehydrogenase
VSGRIDARGLVLDALGERPRLRELTVEPPGPGEVRVRMRAAGLCHTDVSQVRDARFTPVLLGHEGAGEVESVGPGAEGLSPGDPVLVCWKVPCGRCRRCLRDEPHLCEAVVGLAEPRVFRDGEPVGAMLNAGCFCDHVVLPAAGAIPIRADVPFEEAALVGCAVVTGVGAALWTARVAEGDAVAVFGAGGVGLNVVVGARLAGAGRIVAVDPDPQRRELALARGATEAIAPDEPLEPVDYAFEVVGEPAVMERAVESLAPGGELVLVGAAARDATVSFRPRAFLSMQQRISGCIYGSATPAEHLPRLLAWAADGTIPLADLIGRRVTLDELENAFDEPANGGVRTVVTFP